MTALAVVAGLSAAPPSVAAPAVACGDTLTVDTVLTSDLTCGAQDGLRMLGGVTLDLGGHTLRGPGRGGGGPMVTAVAITVDHISSPGAVTLRNGTIEDWDAALVSTEAWGTEAVVQHMTFRAMDAALTEWLGRYTVESSTFEDVSGAVAPSLGSITVSRSRFDGPGVAVGGYGNGDVVVSDSVFTGNQYRAAVVCDDERMTLTRSVLTGNAVGLYTTGCDATVDRTTFDTNGVGVHVESIVWQEVRTRVERSTFTGNTTAVLAEGATELVRNRFVENAAGVRTSPEFTPTEETVTLDRNAFLRNGDAVYLESPARLHANRVLHSSGYGIYAPLATDLGRNVAVGNGVEPQCTGVVCRGG